MRLSKIQSIVDKEEAQQTRQRRASALSAKSWYALVKKSKDFSVLQALDWTPRQLVAFPNALGNKDDHFKKSQVKKAALELDRPSIPVLPRAELITTQTCSMADELESMGGKGLTSDADLEPGWWKTDVAIKRASRHWDHAWERQRLVFDTTAPPPFYNAEMWCGSFLVHSTTAPPTAPFYTAQTIYSGDGCGPLKHVKMILRPQ